MERTGKLSVFTLVEEAAQLLVAFKAWRGEMKSSRKKPNNNQHSWLVGRNRK